MKKLIIFILFVLLVLECAGCFDHNTHPGATMDWGPDHYWDSSTNTVKEKLW